jgi:HSP20 family protein
MSANRADQQTNENATMNRQRSEGGSGQATQASPSTANTGISNDATSKRGDQERALQSGREDARSTGVSRRPQTAPVYPGRGQSSPFSLMRRMAEDMDRLFEDFAFGRAGLGLLPAFGTNLDRGPWQGGSALDQATAWAPQVETFRRGDNLVVRADLPGLKKEDVKVEIDDGVLTISGERRDEHEEDRGDYYRSERTYGQFYRAIPLPDSVNADQCEASFKDGVLEVSLAAPRDEKRKAKQIQVK